MGAPVDEGDTCEFGVGGDGEDGEVPYGGEMCRECREGGCGSECGGEEGDGACGGGGAGWGCDAGDGAAFGCGGGRGLWWGQEGEDGTAWRGKDGRGGSVV